MKRLRPTLRGMARWIEAGERPPEPEPPPPETVTFPGRGPRPVGSTEVYPNFLGEEIRCDLAEAQALGEVMLWFHSGLASRGPLPHSLSMPLLEKFGLLDEGFWSAATTSWCPISPA